MVPKMAVFKKPLMVLFDVVTINVAFAVAYLIRFDWDVGIILEQYSDMLFYLALIATLVKICTYFAFRVYCSLWNYAGIYEIIHVAGAVFVANAVMLGFVFLDRLDVPRSIFVITAMLDVFFLGGSRICYKLMRNIIRGGPIGIRKSTRVLLVGGGDAGALVVKELQQNPGMKMKPVAIVDDDPAKLHKKINGVPIMGNRINIVSIAKKKQIDEIIIAIPSAGRRAISEITDICSETGCKVKSLPSLAQLIDESVIIQKLRDVDADDLLERDPVNLDMDVISSYLAGKSVLVTGGGGSIGSELCRQIALFGPSRFVILDNYENNLFDINNELVRLYPELKIIPVIASIREKPRLEAVFARHKPDVVFHAAAHKHVPLMELNPAEAVKNNIFGTANVAECAEKYGAKRFILISTDKAVNPTCIMGATKRTAEMVIQAMNHGSRTEFVAVRFGNVLGSNGSVIPVFRKQILAGGPVTVTHPEVTRFFMTITEAVQLVIQAGAMAQGGEIFVLDMGKPVKIYDLALKMIRLSGLEPDADIKIEFTGLRPGEKLYEELLMAEEGLRATANDKIFVAKPLFTDLVKLRQEIDALRSLIIGNTTDIDDLGQHLMRIVPNYKQTSA